MKRFFSFILFCLLSWSLFARVTVTMESSGGVYKVPCVVNGLRMKFIFDTGASTVCISKTMYDYMMDNDYLSGLDIVGGRYVSVADGRTVWATTIQLSTIEIGGLTLHDIEATVISGQSAPLLLGQSALSQLGKYSISGNQLIIEEAGSCSKAEIDNWAKLADNYFDNGVYDKALLYYQRMEDCDGLSEIGYYIMGLCYENTDKIDNSISTFQLLARNIENNTSTLSTHDKALVYGQLASLYRKKKNYNTCIAYDKKSLNYMSASDWKYEAQTHYEMALCYQYLRDYSRADGSAIMGIGCILRNKYPSVHSEWARYNYKNLATVLGKYRWGKEETLGDLLSILCEDYLKTTGNPHCQLISIAAEMGSEIAQQDRDYWRSSGICSSY